MAKIFKNAYEHYKETVLPVYKEKGLCPEFAALVDAHVAEWGTHQIWNFHGDADGRDPKWFDGIARKVKPLKLAYVVDEG